MMAKQFHLGLGLSVLLSLSGACHPSSSIQPVTALPPAGPVTVNASPTTHAAIDPGSGKLTVTNSPAAADKMGTMGISPSDVARAIAANAATQPIFPLSSKQYTIVITPSDLFAAGVPTTLPTSLITAPAADLPFPNSFDPRQTVPFLASDSLAGRLPGQPGLRRAGDFLAAEFARIGLKPLPGHDYFQPFTMTLSTALGPATNLTINDKPLFVGTDFNPLNLSQQGDFHGKLVFAGYAITHAQGDYDDFAGLDVKGKVVLAMMKEPLNANGTSRFAGPNQTWSPSAYFSSKAKAAAAHGAVALLLVSPPSSGGADSLTPFFAENGGSSSPIPVVQISRRMTDVLLANAEVRDLKTLQDQIDSTFKPLSTDLQNLDVAGNVTVKKRTAVVRNVMACLPGAGPHADEWIVVGAHYDHLGTGQLGHMMPGLGGGIYHGADDNASGTSAVIELAERLKEAGPLARSVLFVCFTGEEEGLIGSDYFVRNCPLPIDRIAAMLNMDMVGRLKNDNLLLGGAATAPIFDSMVTAAITGTGLNTQTFERGGLGPSDHMSFALKKIPVLFLFTGLHMDYHRPTDTADKINYAGIDTIVTVADRIVNAMAVMPRQQYNGSEDSNSTMAFLTGHAGRHRAVLGVVPDYSSTESRSGVPITGVGQDTAAEKAGLKGGDLVVGYNKTTLNNLQDLSDVLAEASPGDTAVIKVVREGKTLEFHVVLGSR
jgi:hypothetical protein